MLHKLDTLVCRFRVDWKESQLNFNAVRWVLCFFLLCLLNNFYSHCILCSLPLLLLLSLSLLCEVYTKCHQIAIFTFILNDIYVSQWLHFISNWNCLLSHSLTAWLEPKPSQAQRRRQNRGLRVWRRGLVHWLAKWIFNDILISVWAFCFLCHVGEHLQYK